MPAQALRSACTVFIPGEDVRRSDMAVAWIPEPSRLSRGETSLSPGKRAPGEARRGSRGRSGLRPVGTAVSINGRRVALRRKSDPLGDGRCLGGAAVAGSARNEYFLLMDSRLSFDGRYFGLNRQIKDTPGRAELLWAKPASERLRSWLA